MGEKVRFEMNKEEAIVLFAYLARVNDTCILDPTFESSAEQIVLWNVQASLEKELMEPFTKDYQNVVLAAQKSILNDSSTKTQSPKKADHLR